jgi:hypothetical protein
MEEKDTGSRIHLPAPRRPQRCEHSVQIHADDKALLDTLERFVDAGLKAEDCVFVIATAAHLEALERRLMARDVDCDTARLRQEYIPLDAEEMLSRIIVGGLPDADRFYLTVAELVTRLDRDGRQLRFFEEMVGLLWTRQRYDAAIRLECLWHRLCLEAGFVLFCAYPQSGFRGDACASAEEIGAIHSHVISG